MNTQTERNGRQLEERSLTISMWGNFFMAVAGVTAGFMSNSGAIMVDGLFSLIGFISAVLGRRVSERVMSGPDRHRPFGYAADEAIFVTFRSLSLLGLVLFAITSATKNIYDYLNGAPPEELNFGPMMIYFLAIGATCILLWITHRHNWILGGRKSDILRLEARAAAFDGAMTAAAGVGLGAVYLLQQGPLAPIAPIGDSIIVLFLCLSAIGQYYGGFRSGLGELAGVAASPDQIAMAQTALQPALAEDGGRLNDLSLVKIGRSHIATVYYDPGRPVTARQVDTLNLRLIRDMRAAIPESDVVLLITEHARRWPKELNPYGD